MRWPWLLLLVLNPLTHPAWAAAADPLEALLQQVRQASQAQQRAEKEREHRFLRQRDARKRLLAATRAELAKAQAHQQELQQRIEGNRQRLAVQRALLKEQTGSLGELFGTVRQVASESREIFADSLLSVTRREDLKLLDALAKSRELPSIDRLRGLWRVFLERMVASGRIARFRTQVITSQGLEVQEQVTRVGPFDAVAQGRYLRYLPATGRLVELGRQPAARYQLMARRLEAAKGGLVRMAVDPSRGAILSLLVQTPTLAERIRQGGVIGYIIIALGLLGLLLVLWRLAVLLLLGRRVRRQLKAGQARADNPLGRLLQAAREGAQLHAEALQLRLDELILKEIPGLRRGLKTVGIFAAVAPLLGLLGTVTGMIATFQSITLFGTGDPRLMSGGISQALVTTELGLVAAIPLVLLHSFLSGRSNQLIQLLDQQSATLVAERAQRDE